MAHLVFLISATAFASVVGDLVKKAADLSPGAVFLSAFVEPGADQKHPAGYTLIAARNVDARATVQTLRDVRAAEVQYLADQGTHPANGRTRLALSALAYRLVSAGDFKPLQIVNDAAAKRAAEAPPAAVAAPVAAVEPPPAVAARRAFDFWTPAPPPAAPTVRPALVATARRPGGGGAGAASADQGGAAGGRGRPARGLRLAPGPPLCGAARGLPPAPPPGRAPGQAPPEAHLAGLGRAAGGGRWRRRLDRGGLVGGAAGQQGAQKRQARAIAGAGLMSA